MALGFFLSIKLSGGNKIKNMANGRNGCHQHNEQYEMDWRAYQFIIKIFNKLLRNRINFVPIFL